MAAFPLMLSVAKPNYISFVVPLLGVLAIEKWRHEVVVTRGMKRHRMAEDHAQRPMSLILYTSVLAHPAGPAADCTVGSPFGRIATESVVVGCARLQSSTDSFLQ